MNRGLKTGILILILIGAAAGGWALSAGPVGGAGLEWIGGSDWENSLDEAGYDETTQSGFSWGAFLDFPLSKIYGTDVSLRSEVLLRSPRGKGSSDTGSLRVTSRYLQFPVLARVLYPLGSGSVYLVAGPSFNLILKEISVESESGGIISNEDLTPYYGLVWGLIFGAGYELPLSGIAVSAELRYGRTIGLIFKDMDTAFTSVTFLLGAGFPIR